MVAVYAQRHRGETTLTRKLIQIRPTSIATALSDSAPSTCASPRHPTNSGRVSRAASKPPSNGGNQHEDDGLHEHGEVGLGRCHAGSLGLDPAHQDVAVGAAFEVGDEDFLGRE